MSDSPPWDGASTESLEGDTPRGLSRPRVFGDFEIVREIGRGGMGVVYEARQVSLDRPVALKVLHRGLGLTDSAIARFQREAHAAARLNHPNIVPIYGQGELEASYYYAMELIDGVSIDRLLAPQPADGEPDEPGAGGASVGEPADDSLAALRTAWSSTSKPRAWYQQISRMLAEVADALHYAHLNGVVHRDIKPHNLIVSRGGRICVTDFGLARVSEEPGMTLSGELVGSPLYMSPEQISGGRAGTTPQSDIYSLGVTLYQILAGRPPFLGRARDQVITQIMSREPVPPRRINPEVPIDLETICLKATSKDPRRRYADAGAMADDLARFAEGQRIRARRAGYLGRVRRFVARHAAVVGFTAAVLVLALVVASLGWSLRETKRTERARDLEVSQSQRTQQGAELADKAEELLKQGDYEASLAVIQEAIGLFQQGGAVPPEKLTQAYELIGRAYNALGEYEKAIRVVEGVLPRNPLSGAFHAILAEAYRASDPALAALHQQHLESLWPDSPDALYLQALSEADYDAQMQILDLVLQADPSHFRALEKRAMQFFSVERYERMKEDTLRLVSLRQKDGYAWALNAVAHLMVGDLATSTQSFRQAVELAAADPRIYQIRARAYLRAQRFLEAVADASRAIELSRQRSVAAPGALLAGPGQDEPPLGAGRRADAHDLFSIDEAEKGIGLQVDPELFSLRAEGYYYLEQWPDCVFDCDRAIELGSTDPRVYALRAAGRYRMSLPELALRDIEEAIRLAGRDEDLLRFRDLILAELGRAGEGS